MQKKFVDLINKLGVNWLFYETLVAKCKAHNQAIYPELVLGKYEYFFAAYSHIG